MRDAPAICVERRGPPLDRGDAGERRPPLAADGGGHLVGAIAPDAMRLADVVERAAIARITAKTGLCFAPHVVERGAVGGDVLGAAPEPRRDAGHLIDALDERAGRGAGRAQR